MIFAIAGNLLILGFFKYYGFLIETVNSILPTDIPYRELALPVGISFYTFQAISYILDVYWEKAEAQKNILYFALYISMFPQLIAGPIVRYADIEEQLIKRKMSASKIGVGAMYFIMGLAKKAVLANTVGEVFEEISEMPAGNLSILTAWIGVFSYAFQIYFDFSGYSDMAIGLGKMFGFDFKKNFDYPYISKSVTEFWRRWHISLSTWFREYVYIPLGGNQCSVSRNIFNLMVVWTLTGMWHGAAWNFVAWGVYYGVILVMEKYIWGAVVDQLPNPVRHIYTGIIVLVRMGIFLQPQPRICNAVSSCHDRRRGRYCGCDRSVPFVYTLASVSARSDRVFITGTEYYKSCDTGAQESVCTTDGGSSHFYRYVSGLDRISCDRNF